MALLARQGLVHRLVQAVRGDRTAVVLGGPGTGRTTVARAAAAELGADIGLAELGDEGVPGDVALDGPGGTPCIITGGLELHRWLEARSAGPPQARSADPGQARSAGPRQARGPAQHIGGRPVQRFPLVPLTRRQTLFWAEQATAGSLPRDRAESLFLASGGHPAVIAAWLDHRAQGRPMGDVDAALLLALAPLFARMDRELAHPELAGLWTWLEKGGRARVGALRAATGATKGAIDRLVLAGPVARTLREAAEIEIACGLYVRFRETR